MNVVLDEVDEMILWLNVVWGRFIELLKGIFFGWFWLLFLVLLVNELEFGELVKIMLVWCWLIVFFKIGDGCDWCFLNCKFLVVVIYFVGSVMCEVNELWCFINVLWVCFNDNERLICVEDVRVFMGFWML